MKRLPAVTTYYILSFATDFFLWTIFTLNQVYQVSVVGLNPLQLVLVGTMLEAVVFVAEVPTGIVADVYSRRLSIVIGYLLMGAGFVLEGSVPFFLPILAAQLVWGIGYTFTSGATQAWIADEVGQEKAGQAFLRGAQFSQAGAFAGIVLAVGLGGRSVQVPIITGGGLLVILGIFLAVFMPENGFQPTPRQERSNWQHMGFTLRSGLRLVRSTPLLLSLVAIGFFYGFFSEGYDRLWTAHMLEDIGLPVLGSLAEVTWFGILTGTGMLMTMAGTALARRFLDPDSPLTALRVIFTNTIFLIAGLATYALTRNFALATAAYWMVYVTRRLNDPYYSALLNKRLESGVRATVFSMSSQVDAIGQILSGPLVGLIGLKVSLQAAILSTVVLLVPVFFFIQKAKRLEETGAG